MPCILPCFGVRPFLSRAMAALFFLALIPAIASAQVAELSTTSATRATGVSGPVSNVQPLDLNCGIVTIGATEERDYTVQNTCDADLVISEVVTSNP